MTSYSEWARQVALWKAKYGDPAEDERKVDLTKVRLNRKCAKCDSSGEVIRLHRHHKGCEFMLAQHHPNKFARRYLEFRVEDCVDLCEDCHQEIHVRYSFHIRHWRYSLETPGKPTIKECKTLRKKLVKVCDDWLEGKTLKLAIREFFEGTWDD